MTDFPDPSKPGTYPGALTPAFTIQDEIFDDNLIPPLTEEQVAQAREWNQLLANFVDIYEDIRLAIVALGLDPDLGEDLEASFSLISSELAKRIIFILSSDAGFTGDPNVGAPSIIVDAPAGTVFIDETNTKIWQRLTAAGTYEQTFPQAGGGGGGLGIIPHITGRYYGIVVSDGSTEDVPANSFHTSPVTLSGEYDLVGVNVGVGGKTGNGPGVAGSRVAIGIYSVGSDGHADSLLEDLGTLLVDASGDQTKVVSPTLAESHYYLGIHIESVVELSSVSVSTFQSTPTFMGLDALNDNTPTFGSRAFGVSFASGLPATAPTPTSFVEEAVWARLRKA